jgi:hypothetical protein
MVEPQLMGGAVPGRAAPPITINYYGMFLLESPAATL